MKTLQNRIADTRQLRLEADVGKTVRALFARFPTLAGFFVAEEGDVREVSDHAGLVASDEVHAAICEALRDFLDERPEAEVLLHGRTFARALH